MYKNIVASKIHCSISPAILYCSIDSFSLDLRKSLDKIKYIVPVPKSNHVVSQNSLLSPVFVFPLIWLMRHALTPTQCMKKSRIQIRRKITSCTHTLFWFHELVSIHRYVDRNDRFRVRYVIECILIVQYKKEKTWYSVILFPVLYWCILWIIL